MNLGRLQYGGSPGAGSAQEAKATFERGCTYRSELACATLKVAFGENKPYIPNVRRSEQLRRACDTGHAKDCSLIALVNLAMGMKPMAQNDLQRACTMGDGFACAIQKVAK